MYKSFPEIPKKKFKEIPETQQSQHNETHSLFIQQ